MSMKELKNDLKKKLETDCKKTILQPVSSVDTSTSKYFPVPFWKRFYEIECDLNIELRSIKLNHITHIYNPIEYAFDVHCEYLRKFLDGQKKLMFVGMNPGPNGMAQNGVPFGNIKTVRRLMQLDGRVEQPLSVHPKRPITGLSCTIEEPSGVRIWTLIENLAGSLDVFSQQCFMHNFCPLAFFDSQGRNITPGELKGEAKTEVRDICLKYLAEEIQLIRPKVVVAIGGYVSECLKKLGKETKYIASDIEFLRLAHPSPRSVNNNNWKEKATLFFQENNLIKYLQNQD